MVNIDKMKHTTASGIHSFDHTYSLGYEVNHEDWSPFPRVNNLRKYFLNRGFDIDVERLELVTQSYKETEGMERCMQCALAFKNILENVSLYVYEEDLILGEIASPAKAAPIYPEFSIGWIIDEVLHFPFEDRPHDQFYFRKEEDKKTVLELGKYWEGKTVENLIDATLTDDLKLGNEDGAGVFVTNNYHYAGIGHLAVDYEMIMKHGFKGLLDIAINTRDTLDIYEPNYEEKKVFIDSMIIMLEATITYCLRYKELCLRKSEECKEANPIRSLELLEMANNCDQLSKGKPQTFYQALQLFNFATTLIQVEGNGHSISYGRMDQWLYPFYKHDIDNHVITKEKALELIEVEYVKMNNPLKLKDKSTIVVRNGRGFGGESLTVGGVDRNGEDATNDLTMLFIEASAHTRMMNPWLCVRMHENTPYELLIKTVECIRAGFGHPKIFNDTPTIKAMLTKGCSLETARDYCVVGCVEPSLPGLEYGWHDAGYVNAEKIMELALNHGRLLNSDIQLSNDFGGLDTYESFDELLKAVDQEFAYWCERIRQACDVNDYAHMKRKPLPYLSALYPSCLKSAIDVTRGGAIYNGTGPQVAGIATCADALSAIRKLQFEQQKYTGEQLLAVVKDNWEGHDELYALVNSSKMPHYGNDDDEADELFKFIFESYCDNLNKGTNPRGGKYNPGVYTVNANVGLGLNTNASLDGRKNGEPLSDNMGPVHTKGGSHDISGPTALANSVAKVDHEKAINGTLLNIRFPEEAVSGIEGRDNLAAYIKEYISKENMHVQFNIMSADKMKDAQKHPEQYKDMLVRVAGYSAYFVELGKPLQDDLIDRTEFKF